MLVIARDVGESLVIGDDIKVTVMAVQGGMVRFGIDAPREVTVHRSEIYKRIKAREERERQG